MVIIEKVIPKYRILYMEDNIMYAAKGYRIYRSSDKGESWILDGKVEDKKYSMLGSVRLLARLLRVEVSGLLILENGSRVVIAKKGIFVANVNSKKYIRTFSVPRGSKPMNICQDNKGNLYFGEYYLNGPFLQEHRNEVHIYKSEDNALTWSICYTFPKNTIRHIHGIFYDKYTDKLWFTSGDRGDECIIGNSDDGFKIVNIVKQGGQKYRAVKLFFYKDFIVYGTDTQIAQNYIYRFDRKSGTEECLEEIQGSVISGVQVGDKACLSTAIEPSEVNHDKYAHLWFTNDGVKWEEIVSFKKDKYSAKYFQFGRILFPHNAINENSIVFTGNALEKIDNKTISLSLNV